jgi:hypothetical protein
MLLPLLALGSFVVGVIVGRLYERWSTARVVRAILREPTARARALGLAA